MTFRRTVAVFSRSFFGLIFFLLFPPPPFFPIRFELAAASEVSGLATSYPTSVVVKEEIKVGLDISGVDPDAEVAYKAGLRREGESSFKGYVHNEARGDWAAYSSPWDQAPTLVVDGEGRWVGEIDFRVSPSTNTGENTFRLRLKVGEETTKLDLMMLSVGEAEPDSEPADGEEDEDEIEDVLRNPGEDRAG